MIIRELILQNNYGIFPVNKLLEIYKSKVETGGIGSDPWSKLELRSRTCREVHGRKIGC
jgi:hypothetical protein